MKQALACLNEAWPRALAFDTLAAAACARLASAPALGTLAAQQEIQLLARALLNAYATSGRALVELSLQPPDFVVTVGERPLASPLARLQAAHGLPIANLRHEMVAVSPFDRHLLPCLDGERDRAALVKALVERFEQGALTLTRDDEPVLEPLQARPLLGEVLEQQLPKLAQAALLLA
jgi:methyltransferase-like protein